MPEIIGARIIGQYVGAICYYCRFVSQVLVTPDNAETALDDACAASAAHERTHPEYKEPPTLEQLRANINACHENHDCRPAKCVCICGCEQWNGCTAMFGSLCTHCYVRVSRGDDDHGEPVSGVSVGA